MKTFFIFSAIIIAGLTPLNSYAASKALKLCASASGQVLARSKCKKGETVFTIGAFTSAGAAGAQGAQGVKGETGAQGAVGPTGAQGPAGVTGFETVSAPGGKIVVPACNPIVSPFCLPGIPGLPGGSSLTVSVSCPAGKIIFASICPDKKITPPAPIPGFPVTDISVLISSTNLNGTALTCNYSNTTASDIEIPFTPTVVCGLLP